MRPEPQCASIDCPATRLFGRLTQVIENPLSNKLSYAETG
jgi:hypothetical protein